MAHLKKQSNLASKINWERYSSFFTLTRHVAWIIKLKTNWIKRKRGALIRENFSFLTTIELASSRTLLLQVMQQESFPAEFKALSSGISVHNSLKIASLYPIFHNSLIKVGGRIRRANIPAESKHQIILSKNHHGIQLILRNIHEKNLDVGRDTLAISRQHYWIPPCRGLIRSILRNCVKCINERATPQNNLIGDVPKERVSIGDKPFLNRGIDYFGPYHVKMNKRTRSNSGTAKSYGVLFTCLTTRAVHIELAKDLSTDAFILTLCRFLSRRRNVQVIRSNNGTNFVGANKELKSCVRQLDQPRIIRCLSQNEITWIFNPLTSISNDIKDLEPFTPKHLLIGSS